MIGVVIALAVYIIVCVVISWGLTSLVFGLLAMAGYEPSPVEYAAVFLLILTLLLRQIKIKITKKETVPVIR